MRYYWEVYCNGEYIGLTESFDVSEKTQVLKEEPKAVGMERIALANQAREESEGVLPVEFKLVQDEDGEYANVNLKQNWRAL